MIELTEGLNQVTVELVKGITPAVFYSPCGCVEITRGYWTSKQSLAESIASGLNPPPDARDCMYYPWKVGGLYCPYCGGLTSYAGDVAGAMTLLSHIETSHPEFPLDKPPAWLNYVPLQMPPCALWRIVVNGEVIYQAVYAGGGGRKFPLALPPGEYNVQVTECQQWQTWTGGEPPRTELRCLNPYGPYNFNFTLTNWGDRAICDANSGRVSIQTWEELVPVSGMAVQQFFVVTIPRADKGEYEIHCPIKNIGQDTTTHSVTLYADGNPVETRTFTTAPGETYEYVYSWGMAPKGTSGTVWLVGDWGEETPHISFTAGYSTLEEAVVDCVSVTATTAILRYSALSVTNEWRVSYDGGATTIKVDGSWSTMWCALTRLFPGRTYEVQIQGLDYGYRTAWTTFTTKSA